MTATHSIDKYYENYKFIKDKFYIKEWSIRIAVHYLCSYSLMDENQEIGEQLLARIYYHEDAA